MDSLLYVLADSNNINKEYQEFRNIATAEQLYDYAVDRLPEDGENYLLIDEVQDIENYENALRSFHAENRCQVIATGSNAYIFSSELGTRLSGRYIEIKIFNYYCPLNHNNASPTSRTAEVGLAFL